MKKNRKRPALPYNVGSSLYTGIEDCLPTQLNVHFTQARHQLANLQLWFAERSAAWQTFILTYSQI